MSDSNEQGMNVGKWIGAAVAGALLMYAFDPERGAKRRAHARGALRDARDVTGDKLENAWHHAGDRFESARHRASNVYARAGERLAGVAHAAGDRLSEASHHTRDRLEHARERLADVSHEARERASHAAYDARDRAKHAAYEARDRASHAVHEAREQAEYAADKARDRGEYAAERARERADEARERLEQTAHSVKAETRSRAQAVGNQVREWTDHLSQAFGSHSPTIANSALLGTGALSVVGLARRSPAAALLGLGALAVLLRSDRGRNLIASLRNRGGASFVEVENAIQIDASPKEVFDAWSEVENFPRFMSHVTEVRDLGHRRSHWVVRGPGGLEYAWNAVTTEQSRPDRLSWRSEPGSEIEQEGTVTFESSKGGTRVTVKMRYSPPAGALGHGIARMLGADPQRQMDDDLVRMKDFIEHGDAQYGTRNEAPRHTPLH